MSVDIASLVIEIDSTQADPAIKRMDAMTAAGERLEASARKVKTATEMAGIGIKSSATATASATKSATDYATAEGAVEKATRGATQASATTRAARQLEAAAMRELVTATNTYARDQAKAAKDEAAAIAGLESRIRALKSALDPAYGAQSRLDAEMREAASLYKMGGISASEYAARVAQLDAQMATATRGHTMLNGVMVKGAGSAKFMQRAGLDLSRQFADIGVTAAMGMNPLMILIQQGPQVADILQQGKMQGVGFGAMMKALAVQLGLLTVTVPPAIAEVAALAVAEQVAAAAAAEVAIANRTAATSAVVAATTNQALAATAAEAAAAETALATATMRQAAANGVATAAAAALATANEAVAVAATAAAAAEAVALAPIAAILAGIGAALAVVAVGFALGARAMNKENGDLTKGLGLTADQLEKVKHKGVTMGDTLVGTFNYLAKSLGPILKPIADGFNWVLDKMTAGFVGTIKFMVGGFIGAFEAIKATWAMLPAAMGDLTVSAVNVTLGAIERMINMAGDLLNKLIEKANGAAKAVGLTAQLPMLGQVSVGRMANPDAGAASRTADVGATAFAAGMKRGNAIVDGVLRGLSESIVDAAIKRIKKEAGKGPKGAADPRDQTDERTAQIDAMLAQARADELQARMGLTKDIQTRADLEKQVLTEDLAKKQADVARQAANIVDDKGLDKAKKLELLGQLKKVEDLNAQASAHKVRAVDEAASDALAKQALDIASAQRSGQVDILQSQLELATTAAQRGAIEAQLLDLADQQARAAAQGVIAAHNSTAAQVEIAKTQLATLEATKGAREAAQQRKTAVAGADEIIKELGLIDSLAVQAGSSLESAFGRAGGALNGLLTSMTGFRLQMAEIDKAALSNELTQAQASRERAALQVRTYGDMASAAKGFFKTGSTGYKAMETAEKVYRAFEFAMAVKSIFFKGAQTAATVANAGASIASDAATTTSTVVTSAIKATAHGVVAIARAMASLPFPFNLAAGAATAAALAAFGVKVFGGGGGGASIPTAEERQKTQGTGSVLGDATAKSGSIAHSLEIVAANTNRDLEYSNGMLRALRSIDQNIGALTDVLARQLGVGGAFDTSSAKFGTTTSGPGIVQKILNPISAILPGLFGTKKTTTLLDQGLAFDPQSLDAILNGGLSGNSYQDIQTQTKKKFFGITYSNKTKTSTQTTPLGDDVLAEMQRVIGSLKEGVLAAAGALGVEGADAALKAFTVNLGTISFKDKTGQEIQDELNAIFGKLGDQLSEAVFPAISELQKAGEGAFETLVRVARQYQVIDVTLSSIGKTFGAVGVSSLAARENLVKLFGSLDDFVQQTTFFADNFLTEAERIAPIQASITAEFARLGVTGVNTKDQFKQLVLGLDLTTQGGRDMYAALLAVGPAFAKVADYIANGAKDVEAARSNLQKAYDAEASRLKTIIDGAASAREALVTAYNNESSALQSTIDKFDAFSKSLREFRNSLDTGPAALLSPEAQYNATKSQFADVAAKARLGDADALGQLQGVSQAYLDASRAYYASSGNYFKDLEAVKTAVTAAQGTAARTATNADQQLTALKASVASINGLNTSVLSVAEALAKYQDALTNSTQAQAQLDALDASVAGLLTVNESVLSVKDAIVALQAAMLAAAALTSATPFSPTTSATGSTDPAYTYQPAGVLPPVDATLPTYPGIDPATYTPPAIDPYGSLTPEQIQQYVNAYGGGGFGSMQMNQYAAGGVFTNGVVSQPTNFSVGQMGEAGPEAIMPLVRGPNGLGVRSNGGGANDNAEVVAELKAMREQNDQLRQQVAKLGEAIAESNDRGAEKVAKAVTSGQTGKRLMGGGGV